MTDQHHGLHSPTEAAYTQSRQKGIEKLPRLIPKGVVARLAGVYYARRGDEGIDAQLASRGIIASEVAASTQTQPAQETQPLPPEAPQE